MREITSKITELYNALVTRKAEVDALGMKYASMENEIRDKQKELSMREERVRDVESVKDMYQKAVDVSKKNAVDFDKIVFDRSELVKQTNAFMKDVANKTAALNAKAEELEIREREIVASVARLKEEKQAFKKQILAELSKKM